MRYNNAVFDHYLWFWFCVAAIGFPVALFQFASFEPRVSKLAGGSEPDVPDTRFLQRLPLEMGRKIISLSMQDHYVRVTTDRGSVMILIRFSDAVKRTRRSSGCPGSSLALGGGWSGEADPA